MSTDCLFCRIAKGQVPAHITSPRYIVEQNLTFRDTPRVPDAELAATARGLREALA
ncbi:hypothetical protein D9M68_161550 [compost metagenome]